MIILTAVAGVAGALLWALATRVCRPRRWWHHALIAAVVLPLAVWVAFVVLMVVLFPRP
ncbi:MAG TPA: hypothetical protein VFN38_07595 [Gemmatimonadaceae bacterium]|nr:hypothetical protein [Gemmatimonadaceae bacterium]